MQDLEQRQRKLEDEYTEQGITDALNQLAKDMHEGRLFETQGGRRIVAQTYALVAETLAEICEDGSRGLGGRYRGLVRDIGYDKCAVIALRTALGLLGSHRASAEGEAPVTQKFLQEAGHCAELEHMAIKVTLAAPGYMHMVLKSMHEARTSSQTHRRRTIKASARNVGVTEVAWSAAECDGVAGLLLQSLTDTGLVEIKHTARKSGHYWATLHPSEALDDKLDALTSQLKAFVRFPPMLVPPRPHTRETLRRGAAYLTEGMANLAGTIRTRRGLSRVRWDWIAENVSDTVLNAANTAANVPYVIDTELVQLVSSVYAAGCHNGIAGIPSNDKIQPPPYPLPPEWDRENPELQEQAKAWKALAQEAHAAERERRGKVIAFAQITKHMREFAGDRLYFPTFFDWRGRLYFRSRLNPQGTDVVKAALQFAEKQPLGKRGLYWLKVQVATTYGFDKKHFDTRAVWVDEHMQQIEDAVQNHVDSDFFRAADSHWCFYVAARELLRALRSDDPEAFSTGVPVAMDATCSGLQVLSALFRDPVGGLFTNLMPNEGVEKEDIYAAVSGVAVSLMQKDAENLEQRQFWLDAGITRSMAKRPVMTYVYGGTLQSCMDYVYADMQERNLGSLELYSGYKLAGYVSKFLRQGIECAVPAAAEAMRYFRALAGSLPPDELMRWVSPAGFPVVQFYPWEDVVRLNLTGAGVMLSMSRQHSSKLDRGKAVNGVSPNFVHSLDSAHLVRTIVEFPGQIVPIHDSFATHPCDVDSMHETLRDVFASMYENSDPVQSMLEHSPVDPEIARPSSGALDVSKVRESVFFMC